MEATFDDAGARKFIRSMVSKARNPGQHNKLVAAISVKVFADVIKHFKDQSGPKGGWRDWSTSYTEHMKRIGRGNNKLLQFSGRLRQSMTMGPPRKDGLAWFNNAVTKGGYPYAWGHDTGDGKLPQREFMWLSNEGMDVIGKIVMDHIIKEDD